MARYARGEHALGICDKTGFQYKLKDLRYEFRNGKPTGFRVGKDVLDKDHPQNFIGRVRTDDPQSLRDPRPDSRDDVGLFGFNPVGNPATYLTASLGSAIIVIPVPEFTYIITEGGDRLRTEGGDDLVSE